MDNSLSISRDYESFGLLASTVGAMEIASQKLALMETPENLERFAKKIAADWKKSDNNVATLKLTFADFERKMESKRAEIDKHLNSLRRNRKVARAKQSFQDSAAL